MPFIVVRDNSVISIMEPCHKNWIATLSSDKKKRFFWPRKRGFAPARYGVPSELAVGQIVEFGADIMKGNKERIRNRKLVIIKSVSPTEIGYDYYDAKNLPEIPETPEVPESPPYGGPSPKSCATKVRVYALVAVEISCPTNDPEKAQQYAKGYVEGMIGVAISKDPMSSNQVISVEEAELA